MTAAAPGPDLDALLDAYALLEVEHSADPAGIRQAYKQAARKHHPDRHPAGSPEQKAATERMTAINAAYQLVRDAPLRHHRVSTGTRPDDPWTDTELDEAIRRAQSDRFVANVMSGVTVLFALCVPWLLMVWLSGVGTRTMWFAVIINGLLVLAIARNGSSYGLWRVLYHLDVVPTVAFRLIDLFLSRR